MPPSSFTGDIGRSVRQARRDTLGPASPGGIFIAFTADSSIRHLTDLAFAQAETTPTAVAETRTIATAAGMIAAGLGVSAMPELVLPLASFAAVVAATRGLLGGDPKLAVHTPAATAAVARPLPRSSRHDRRNRTGAGNQLRKVLTSAANSAGYWNRKPCPESG